MGLSPKLQLAVSRRCLFEYYWVRWSDQWPIARQS